MVPSFFGGAVFASFSGERAPEMKRLHLTPACIPSVYPDISLRADTQPPWESFCLPVTLLVPVRGIWGKASSLDNSHPKALPLSTGPTMHGIWAKATEFQLTSLSGSECWSFDHCWSDVAVWLNYFSDLAYWNDQIDWINIKYLIYIGWYGLLLRPSVHPT